MAVVMHRFRFYSFRSVFSPELLIRRRNIHFKRSIDDVCYVRRLHTSSFISGLEEFFPPGVLDKGELSPESVKTGRRWHAGELRGKSNEDLQKLWYVLLKERNMLNTLMHEAKRNGIPMPSPERYHKVQKSMAAIKFVISERERVIRKLEKQTWAFDVEQEEEPSNEPETQGQMPAEKDVLLIEQPSSKEGIFAILQRKLFARIWRTT